MENATRSKWPSRAGAVGGSCFSIISFVFSSECVVHSASNLLLRVESCQPEACQSAYGSLSLVNHALRSVPLAWIFQVSEFLGFVKVLRIWRAVKSRWVFLLSFQGPGTLKPILPQNHFTMQPPGWFYGGGPASGQAVLRKPKSTLRLPGGTSFCCGCLVASPMS